MVHPAPNYIYINGNTLITVQGGLLMHYFVSNKEMREFNKKWLETFLIYQWHLANNWVAKHTMG
jgi:hypothetical protein